MKAHARLLALGLLAAPAAAQEPVYQTEKQSAFKLRVDSVARQEWTKEIFVSPTETRDEDRNLFQLRPRLELKFKVLEAGVGGEFNFSNEDNVPEPPEPRPTLLRDNYKSKDARLDLAWGVISPVSWLRLEGGRFFMPVALTEMIWDKDLRPQGGAVTLQKTGQGSLRRLAATALYAEGSHVFEDPKVKTWIFSGEAIFAGGTGTSLALTGSFVRFEDTGGLEPMLRRQNTRVPGAQAPLPLAFEYEVIDLIARYRSERGMALQLVADYSWNTSVDEDNKGLWLAVALGSLDSSVARLEYTYARVGKDATLAAYGTDDFFWVTGWEGHRGDIGFRASHNTSVHFIGQLQRFRDSARAEEQDHWVKRYRIEARVRY